MWKWIQRWGSIAQNSTTGDAPVVTRRTPEITGTYAALHKYLENRYADVVVLTFGQIEDLLGFALPDLARTYIAWWTPTATSAGTPPYSDAWVLAGRTATPNLLAKTVAFERAMSHRH